MQNIEIFKKNIKENDDFIKDFYDFNKDVDSITAEDIVKAIHHDCNICQCYGCRQFTRNYQEKHRITNQECEEYIKNYFSREFNPDTDNCQCDSCIENRGEDNRKKYWTLSYGDKECVAYEISLPDAKSYAINNDFFEPMDYPYIKGELIDV